MSSISSGTTTTTALVYTADTTGNLVLQTGSTPTTAATFDTNQNMGLGVTPSSWNLFKGLQVGCTSVAGYSTGNTLFMSNAYYGSGGYTYINSDYASIYHQTSGQHQWIIAPSGTAGATITTTQAMTLDNSGNLLVGVASTVNSSKMFMQFNGGRGFGINDAGGGAGSQVVWFQSAGTQVGSISTSTSATSYNTSSDRRLKSNIADLTNSGTVIDSLKPRAFTWIFDNSADAGFIADELQTVLPKAVSGQPNAIDAEGNPVYQMIDASQPELIAYLVAEIQSLRARLKAANIA